jgi:hypothetical protein
MPVAREPFPPVLLPLIRAGRPSNVDVGSGELETVKAGQTVGSVLKPRPEVSAAIARLVAFRDRGVISERAFLVQQRRLTGVTALRLPVAPARKKKRHWRKALVITVLLLVGLAILGLKAPQSRGQRSTAADPVPTPTASTGSKGDDVYPLGKAFQLGEYTYTITGCKTAATLGEAFGRIRSGPGATYVVVTFSVRNESKRTRAVPTDDLKLEDAKGIIYRNCRDATTALWASGNENDVFLNEVPPGTTTRSVSAFEVQVASLKQPIKLVIPEVGLFASGTAVVYLNF